MANEADGTRREWPKLRKMADYLYEISEDGVDKTAAEVESEMQVYLLSAIGPLLEAANAVIDEWSQPGQEDPISLYSAKPLQKELDKWRS